MGIYSRGKYLQNQYTSENFNKKPKRNKKLPKQKSVSFMPTWRKYHKDVAMKKSHFKLGRKKSDA